MVGLRDSVVMFVLLEATVAPIAVVICTCRALHATRKHPTPVSDYFSSFIYNIHIVYAVVLIDISALIPPPSTLSIDRELACCVRRICCR